MTTHNRIMIQAKPNMYPGFPKILSSGTSGEPGDGAFKNIKFVSHILFNG